MTALEARMRAWLATGTDVQKRAAAARLALPFDEPLPPAPDAPQPPGPVGKLLNLAEALVEVAAAAAAGNPVYVPAEVRGARLDACLACPQLVAESTCAKCGCNMPLKTWLAALACPEGRWRATAGPAPLEVIPDTSNGAGK
jgi:hypothetical protein